jgi:biopolymer transport protein ExbD
MKISAAKQVHYESGPNMTPLVDVVMVILIFLMLAGSFGSGEHYMLSSTAAAVEGPGGPPPTRYVAPSRIDVSVNREGGVRVPWQSAVITSDADLVAALGTRFDNLRATTAAKDIELVIKPDGQAEWDKLASVYDAGLRAKFERVTFAAAR